jgi:hypothetical protein
LGAIAPGKPTSEMTPYFIIDFEQVHARVFFSIGRSDAIISRAKKTRQADRRRDTRAYA